MAADDRKIFKPCYQVKHASADISRGHPVKLNSSEEALECSAATDYPLGFATDDATAGQSVEIFRRNPEAVVLVGEDATFSYGDKLGLNSDGELVKVSTAGDNYWAVVVQGSKTTTESDRLVKVELVAGQV